MVSGMMKWIFIKNAELLSTVLESLLVVDKIDEEKVYENILIEDSDSDKIDDSDTGEVMGKDFRV